MPYQVIGDFKAGLVRYAHLLSLPPGALAQADNVVLSIAGEIEKRQDIRFLDDIVVNPFAVPRGLISANGKLYSYWHLGSVVGDYITILQAQHPAVLGGASVNLGKHVVTKFICGCAFQNQPFVVLGFKDGSQWAYYGDPPVLVSAFRNGVILDGLTSNDSIAAHLEEVLGEVGEITVERVNNVVTFTAGASATMQVTAVANSTDGTLALANTSDGDPGSAGSSAKALLQLSYIASGGSVTRIEVGDGVTWVDIIDNLSPITAGLLDTLDSFATAIAAAINNYYPTDINKDFAADSSAGSIWVYSTASAGITANTKLLRITVDGPIFFEQCGFTFTAVGGTDVVTTIASTEQDDSDLVQLLSPPVARAGDNANAWAVRISQNINDLSGTSGYHSAYYGDVIAGTILLGRLVNQSSTAARKVVVTTVGNGNVAAIVTPSYTVTDPTFTLTFSEYNFLVPYIKVRDTPYALLYYYPQYLTQWPPTTTDGYVAAGGTPPYTPTWRRIFPASGIRSFKHDGVSPWYQPKFIPDFPFFDVVFTEALIELELEDATGKKAFARFHVTGYVARSL